MLAALILLGLLPFAGFIPEAETVAADGPDTGDDIQSDDISGVDMFDAPDAMPDYPEGAAPDEGLTYKVESLAGTTVLEDFEPGTDIAEIDLTGVGGEIVYETASTQAGASVSFAVGSEATAMIEFPGLTDVPSGDIILKLLDEQTGEPFEMSLSDAPFLSVKDLAIDPNSPGSALVLPELSDTNAGLDPVDPDAGDEPGPDPGADAGLDPVDPDQADDTSTEPVFGPVLQPVGPHDEVLGAEGDLALRDLLERDTENLGGFGVSLTTAANAGTVDAGFGAGDDVIGLGGDGVAGTGAGSLSMSQASPVLSSDAAIDVVDGGAGDDTIATGDAAAFAFGGAGHDSLSAGEGAAALFGGAGNDELSAGSTGNYLDGGQGDDLIAGGAGDDLLEGGEHGAGQSQGDDTIDGGAGDDTIRGGYGADQLSGGAGDDVIDHLGRTEEREIIEHHEFAWHTDGAADSLDGGAGDDTLIFDRSDVATGGAGEDLFWVYHDGADGTGVAEVTDFVVGQDFLRISLNPQIGENEEPEVLVRPSDDGADGWVVVNGDLVAILRGAPDITVSDIYAEVRADVFP